MKDTTSSIYNIDNLTDAKTKLEEYQDIFNGLPIGLYRTSIKDGLFLKANPELAEMLGYENVDDLLINAKSSEFYWNETDREKFLNVLDTIGSIRHYELPIKNANGKKLWVLITARLNKERGYLEGSLMNITEKKELEDRLEEYKMEEAKHLCKINLAAKQRIQEIDEVHDECLVHDVL